MFAVPYMIMLCAHKIDDYIHTQLSLSLSLIFLHKYLEVDLLVEEEEGEVVMVVVVKSARGYLSAAAVVEWDLMLDLAQVVVENLLSLVDEGGEEEGDPWVDDLVIVLAPHLVVVALVDASYLIHLAAILGVVVVVVGATMTIPIMVVVVVVTMMTIELCCHRGEVEEFDQCPAIPH